MLTLILMRHAEAQNPLDSDDHARRLTPRGVSQAKIAAELLKGWGITPELVICSDAERAVETANIVSDSLSYGDKGILKVPFLYKSYTTQELVDCFADCVDGSKESGAECVLCVAHNPDLSYRADALMSEPLPVAFPTAGVLVLGFEAERWCDISARSAFVLRSSFL